MGWGGCGKDWGGGGGCYGGGCGQDWGGNGGCGGYGKGGQDWGGGCGGCGKGGQDWGGGGCGGCGGYGGGGGKDWGGKGASGPPAKGFGGGKSFGGKGGGSNWGGCGVWQPMFNPMMMMKGMGKGSNGLRDFKNDRKLWIGGLPPGTNSKELNKKLKDHLSTAGVPCVYAEIHRTGSGGAAFKSESEAQTAAAALNGSVFEGVMLQVDMWGKKTA
ncbi:unnamed protein product [Effrenium voratum]|uniref:RRM domain-containing protein n=1 Tax=Effrenium voratum TaxID=2562239 RepID=A0AA36IVB4_9DINO|nr:unnamed protein product [Effrenium voratum]CAJ1424368.1 unnamed protein product [Effrenium voratum]